jgi:hypothetical protein
MSRRVDQEFDAQAKAIVALDRRERGLDNRVEAVEGKLRTDQVQTAQDRGLPADLIATEENVWRRLSPARNRWPEIAAFDERVAELEMRQTEKAAELRELRDREIAAPAADADRLATWQLDGEKGPRPDPELSAIKEQIRDRQEEVDALTRATTRVLADKVEFWEKHRPRLEKDADGHVDEKHRRYLDLVDQLADVREDLYVARRTAVLARLYPSEQAGAEPPDTLAGGRKRPLEAMGLSGPVGAERVFDALRADADWLREAATPEQSAAIAGRDPREPPNTVWDETDEGRRWKHAQRQQALERHRNL